MVHTPSYVLGGALPFLEIISFASSYRLLALDICRALRSVLWAERSVGVYGAKHTLALQQVGSVWSSPLCTIS